VAGTRRLEELIEVVSAKSNFPRAPLLLALSGGPDSAAMSFLATRVSESVRAVHVNHGTTHAHGLEEAARAIAETLGVDLRVVPVELTGAEFTEEAAREARYGALRSIQSADEWIVTGHTIDDQAETVLFNLIRGGGLAGVSGIPETTAERIARPLLGVTRGELRELAVLASLPFADDPSNLDPVHARNRIRHEVIPMLQAGFNPRLVAALARTAAAARADDDYLQELASEMPVTLDESTSTIPRSVLLVAPRPLADRALRMLVTNLRPPHPPTRAELSRIWEVVEGEAQRAQLEGGVSVEMSRGVLRLARAADTDG